MYFTWKQVTHQNLLHMNENDLLITYAISAIISLVILYYIIKGAVKSAILDTWEIKRKRLVSEKEALDILLQNSSVTQKEYEERISRMPLGVIYG